MTTKRLGGELLPEEISELARQLYDPPPVGGKALHERLLVTQQAIVETLERVPELTRHFRFLCPREKEGRPEIKSFASIIEKVNSHRRDGKTYDINHLDDLIGAQMHCPYPDDVDEVLNWLYDEHRGGKYFYIVTTRGDAEKERQEREDRTGYKALHICLRLRESVVEFSNLPRGSEAHKFELQIKTMLDAAWDGKTHEVTYKTRDIDPDLAYHMKLLSYSLQAIDMQTLLLRDQIEDAKNARDALRKAAVLLLFHVSLTDISKSRLGIVKDIEDWQEEDADRLYGHLNGLKREKGLGNILACSMGLAVLGLWRADRHIQEEALSYTSLAVMQAEEETELHEAVRLRALLRWAFHHVGPALRDLAFCLERFNDERTIRDKNDFLYYICDLWKVDGEDLGKAAQYLKELESCPITPYLDTIGRFYIRFAKSEADVEKGLDYVRQATQAAQDDELKKVGTAFQRYHEHLALRQLARLRRRR